MKKKKPLTKREKALVAKRRRDPSWRIAYEVARYLETVGWRVVVAGSSQVRGFEQPGLGHYEFAMQFSGGRINNPKSPTR